MKDMFFLPLIPIARGSVVHIECEKGSLGITSQEPDILRDIVIPLHKMYDVPLIMDMDGVLSYDPQIELLKNIAKSFPIWFDGGARFSVDVIDFLVAKIEICCISTKNMDGISELEDAVALSEDLCLIIDVYDGDLIAHNRRLKKMDVLAVGALAEDLGIGKVAYLDYAHLMDQGTPEEDFALLLENDFELYVGGLKPARLEHWQKMGIKGLLLYYKTIFDFQRVRQPHQEQPAVALAPDESRTTLPTPHVSPS